MPSSLVRPVAAACLALAPTLALADDFQGAYALSNWSVEAIADGTSAIDTANSTQTTAVFTYEVDFGTSGGVTQRVATFSMVAPADATVTVDWSYAWIHAWFQARGELTFFAEDASGVRQTVVAANESSFGDKALSGSLAPLNVHAGRAWGFTVGGSNFDSNSFLRGKVTLTDLDVTPGHTGGATDCKGIVGGPNLLDPCGTCDDDPSNDCVQDCAGTWGGTATEDRCGTCDDNPANDCVQDCANVWGGTAEVDDCGVCSGGTTGIPVDDCLDTDTGAPEEDSGPPPGRPLGDTDADDPPAPGPGAVGDSDAGADDDTFPASFAPTEQLGCGCATARSGPMGGLLLTLGLLGLRRRRR